MSKKAVFLIGDDNEAELALFVSLVDVNRNVQTPAIWVFGGQARLRMYQKDDDNSKKKGFDLPEGDDAASKERTEEDTPSDQRRPASLSLFGDGYGTVPTLTNDKLSRRRWINVNE